jgi:DNA-binding CsgD family transcriptional regulator
MGAALQTRSRREGHMTAEEFTRWLADMKSAGLARSDAECARLLDISANAVVTIKKNGTDTRTALACRALLHRLEPYS